MYKTNIHGILINISFSRNTKVKRTNTVIVSKKKSKKSCLYKYLFFPVNKNISTDKNPPNKKYCKEMARQIAPFLMIKIMKVGSTF